MKSVFLLSLSTISVIALIEEDKYFRLPDQEDLYGGGGISRPVTPSAVIINCSENKDREECKTSVANGKTVDSSSGTVKNLYLPFSSSFNCFFVRVALEPIPALVQNPNLADLEFFAAQREDGEEWNCVMTGAPAPCLDMHP